MRRLLVVLALAGSLLVLAPGAAFACSCATDTVPHLLGEADAVVEAHPLHRESLGNTTRYTMKVDAVLKGETGRRILVKAGGGCGLDEVAQRPTYYFLEGSGGVFSASLCRQPLDRTPAELRAVLGPGHPPDPGLDVSYARSAPLLFWGTAGAGVLVLAVAVLVTVHFGRGIRRRSSRTGT